MGTGKKKIEIKRKEKESARVVTFSKRRTGLFKKAREFHQLTGTRVAIMVFSPAGRPYTHSEPSSFEDTAQQYLKSGSGGDDDTHGKLCSFEATAQRCLKSSTGGDDDHQWRSFMDLIRPDVMESEGELLEMKMALEDLRKKLIQKEEDEFIASLLALENPKN